MSSLYGLFANLDQRQVLVAGGGQVAERKITSLLKTGAIVQVVAHTLTPQLGEWVQAGLVRHLARHFDAQQLDNCWLVIAATNDKALNQQIANAANARHIWVNVVDDSALSRFHVPALIDRGKLQIALSSGGAAPAIARKIKADIETSLDESVGALVNLVAHWRGHIQQRLPDLDQRRHFYDALLTGPVTRLLKQQRTEQAEQTLDSLLSRPQAVVGGHVTLVGAGPGDPGLLTLNALRALQNADIVFYDRLVSNDILQLIRKDAERVSVGKTPGKTRNPQGSINQQLLDAALAGKQVVRLKGGDPFIFGRGGEELQLLAQHQVNFSVVPGITAAAACGAYAGIPLTHRDHAQSVRFVTAHCKQSIDRLDWSLLAAPHQTLAFYMGVGQLANIRRQLLLHGMAKDTPLALIESGSRHDQRVIRGNLGQLEQLAKTHAVQAPAILLIGSVTQLADTLSWFGQPPLHQVTATPNTSPAAPVQYQVAARG